MIAASIRKQEGPANGERARKNRAIAMITEMRNAKALLATE
jgi:hypothetical protein